MTYDGEEFTPIPGCTGCYISQGMRVLNTDSRGNIRECNQVPHMGHVTCCVYDDKRKKRTMQDVVKLLYMAQNGKTMEDIRYMTRYPRFTVDDEGRARLMNISPREPEKMNKFFIEYERMGKNAARHVCGNRFRLMLANVRDMERILAELVENGNERPLLDELEYQVLHHVIPVLMKTFGMGEEKASCLAAYAKSETLSRIFDGKIPYQLGEYMTRLAYNYHKERAKKMRHDNYLNYNVEWFRTPAMKLMDPADYEIELYR